MKILIVEDELPAAKQLQRLLHEIDPTYEIGGQTQSVARTVEWLQNNETPDIVFMDIHLSDDLSFSIFEQIEVPSPVVFTTAYDEYALQAFKVNSIDYLLKPIDKDELHKSIDKLKRLTQGNSQQHDATLTHELAEMIMHHKPAYKNRFLVKRGEQFLSIPVEEITHFVSEYKVTYCITRDQLKFSIENTLEELEKMLEQAKFFRLNRQCIIHFNAIDKIHTYFNGKLLVQTKSKFENEFKLSKERAREFKLWLNQ
jgi:DNA-binding LytR/AlgR family response regulator